ncbi:hypothetical protein C6503_11870 [Candidatus Poribacteria bacterium]|nr:MAG: hypothetical protein C6503_11870 [Candidatus Poribacteria bacterium]
MFFRIYCHPRVSVLLTFVFLMITAPLSSNAQDAEFPAQKLVAIFPKTEKFVQKSVVLTPDQITSIEKDIAGKLRTADLKPIFYIPINDVNKPIGLVLFAGVEGPNGIIEGAVALNMRGKVVKVEVYVHKESEAIASAEFLKQFTGMGIDDAFTVGEDIAAIEGHEEASDAVALLPRKTLVMSYALFLKQERKPGPEEIPESDTPEEMPEEEEMPEVEDLKALMMLMIDDYFVVVDYFDDKVGKAKAVEAAKRLAKYAKSISSFEPPKNADQTEEYVYLQDKFSDTLLKFAEALEEEGISDGTREQWNAIVELINQAHLRFSEEEIDLDTY